MNFSNIQNWFTFVCAAGGLVCIAALVLYSARHVLRELLDQLHAASRLTKLVVFLAFAGATLFGGAKHGSPTNTPPACGRDVLVASGGDEDSLIDATGTSRPQLTMLPPQTGNEPPPSTSTSDLNLATNWTRRGAYCDWKRIDFPDTFSFPSGTNLMTGVTLMSYGELRSSLRGPVVANVFAASNQLPTTNQPTTLTLEPGASSVSYGLTPSNSFVFVWENACVNRDPTNRVNAAIELYLDGTIETRFGDLVGRVAPRPPEGFIGEGQDDAWVTNAFPTAASNIVEKGYSTWLEEDYVGINEENGHFRADITVSTLPSDGVPCYLVCGPYKVVVTHPGVYSFPLEVFETYEARTYPVAVPLSISTDDGYSGETTQDVMMSAPLMTQLPLILPPVYVIREEPRLVLSPSHVPLSQAVGTVISTWCNVANAVQTTFSSSNGIGLRMIAPSKAEIFEARLAGLVTAIKQADKGLCSGSMEVYDDTIHEHHDDWTCCCGSMHCPNCTCYGCLYEGICYCGHVLTDEELERLWGGSEP